MNVPDVVASEPERERVLNPYIEAGSVELTEEWACYTVLNMVEAIEKPASRTRPKQYRKINPDHVKELLDKGVSTKDIAAAEGVSRWGVAKFVERSRSEFEAVDIFKQNRAEIFARIGARNLSLQDALLDRLSDDGILRSLTPTQIASLLFALNSQHGTIYDKERLERGQSTQNHSIMTRMLHSSVDSAYKSDTSGIVAVPTKVRNAKKKKVDQLTQQSPAEVPPPPSPSVQGEAGRGDSLAASVYGHPTESPRE